MRAIMMTLLFAALGSLAGANFELAFEDPKSFRDFSVNGRSAEKTVDTFESEFQRFAENQLDEHLPEGYTLSLRLKDIDMAGDIQPWRSTTNPNVRYVESVYPPRMQFDYTLTDGDGNEVASGDARLRDMNFQLGNTRTTMNNYSFHYELAMLADWIRKEIRPVAREASAS